MTVAARRGNAIQEIFGRSKVVIGVVHCLPLPGSPDYDGTPVTALLGRALEDARAYVDAGLDGLIVENHGDVPFLKPDAIGPETPAMMAVIADRVREATGVPIGINVLANAVLHALAVAKAAGAAFVRVNQWANAYVANEGLIEGAAAQALRYRALLAGPRRPRVRRRSRQARGARDRCRSGVGRTGTRRGVLPCRRDNRHRSAHRRSSNRRGDRRIPNRDATSVAGRQRSQRVQCRRHPPARGRHHRRKFAQARWRLVERSGSQPGPQLHAARPSDPRDLIPLSELADSGLGFPDAGLL